jgi:hypothetical protein
MKHISGSDESSTDYELGRQRETLSNSLEAIANDSSIALREQRTAAGYDRNPT